MEGDMIRNTHHNRKFLKVLWGAVSGMAVIAAIILGPFAARPSIAGEMFAGCQPTEMGVFTKKQSGNRVHVRCSTAPAGTSIYWFAYGSNDSANADKFLNVINFAMQNGKTLTIWYDPISQKGPSIGCQAGDCRLIEAMTAY
jgi:hypothetical protein